MRSLLALILSWLMPSTGKRRATPPTPTPHLTDEPTRRLTITRAAVGVELPSHRSPRPPAYLRGEDTPLIRPYLVAHEREQERRRQRDRRTAAALATLGIDFPTLSLDIHGVTA
ncbi:hypothetical protein [Actinacidiphila bryophytorum]|uniref:Uncharacterized protein n=1 Tax=Actinacidiphila bryophytorum TaxID=1436133 RepID=A0A9W4E3K8_9ACTN|nr:hypothetical protein [Actinacidiphila bryophytorum]CAG7626065.1 conserved exported hypothetical protein [Actinacidiphila bryophytorum]